jgi:hypothetical protein
MRVSRRSEVASMLSVKLERDHQLRMRMEKALLKVSGERKMYRESLGG